MPKPPIPTSKPPIAPPREPGAIAPRPETPVLWILGCIALMCVAACSVLLNGYWCFVISANAFTGAKAAWFWSDAAIRLTLSLTLCGGTVLLLARHRLAGMLLFPWAAARVMWPPISVYVSLQYYEPPPDVMIALLMMALMQNAAFPPWASVYMTSAFFWLFLPGLVVVMVLKRPRNIN